MFNFNYIIFILHYFFQLKLHCFSNQNCITFSIKKLIDRPVTCFLSGKGFKKYYAIINKQTSSIYNCIYTFILPFSIKITLFLKN